MRAVKVARDAVRLEELTGRVLCQDLRSDDGRSSLAKGRVLDASDAERALTLPWSELHLLVLDDGDVHEDAAGERLARAAAGEGIEVRSPSGGHWPLVATARGLLAVDRSALRAVNDLEGPCVYTLYDGQVVDAGEGVARAKITPFAVPREVLERAEAAARGSTRAGLISVRAFRPHRVAAVVRESLGERGMARFREALAEKVGWFGSTVSGIESSESTADSIAQGLTRARRAGADVLTIAGTKAMDALDPTFEALAQVGAQMWRHGVPAHPGSLFWLARWDGLPVLGMPTCGLFAQATVFDLVLARILAGERVGRAELGELAHGGFLTKDMAFRFPRYRQGSERGSLD